MLLQNVVVLGYYYYLFCYENEHDCIVYKLLGSYSNSTNTAKDLEFFPDSKLYFHQHKDCILSKALPVLVLFVLQHFPFEWSSDVIFRLSLF